MHPVEMGSDRLETGAAECGAGRPAAVDRVVASLADFVIGQLSPGAALPSEAELADAHKVSRLTIREAIKVLAGRGLVEVARGRRAVVREPDGAVFGAFLAAVMRHDAKGLFDLVEVRQALEIQSASLAAKRANRAGLTAIDSALDGMRAAAAAIGRDPDEPAHMQRFHQFDVGFHEALALSSGNRMLTFLLEAMAEPLRLSFQLSVRGRRQRGQSLHDTIDAHARILAAVRAGDGRAAAQAMRAHLKDAERDIRAALQAGAA